VTDPPARARIGCSGWDYPEWVGPVYPRGPNIDRLAHYATLFPIVEINTSFYHLPTPRTVRSWARRTPHGFGFAAKLPQEITHRRRLNDVEEPLRAFFEVFDPLLREGRLLAILAQLPPSLPFRESLARRFYEQLPRSPPVVIEFREPSWLQESSYDLLKEWDLTPAIVDEPHLSVPLFEGFPLVYIRWHGHGSPVWYDYRYSDEELRQWVPRVKRLERSGRPVLGFFNNHFRGDAARNALTLSEFLELPPPAWTRRLDFPSLPPEPRENPGAS
jgi:uncharacterized protein YecE (DUF72 family)